METTERAGVLDYFKEHNDGGGITVFIPPASMTQVYSIYEDLDRDVPPYCESLISVTCDRKKGHDFVINLFSFISNQLARRVRNIATEMNEEMGVPDDNESNYKAIYGVLYEFYEYKCSLYSALMESQM